MAPRSSRCTRSTGSSRTSGATASGSAARARARRRRPPRAR
jgi:hypothetical protein